MLNFFALGGRMTLVDMPGYGFGSEAAWGDLVAGYWRARTQYGPIYARRYTLRLSAAHTRCPRALDCAWPACWWTRAAA
jgi:hypothetical protein